MYGMKLLVRGLIKKLHPRSLVDVVLVVQIIFLDIRTRV